MQGVFVGKLGAQGETGVCGEVHPPISQLAPSLSQIPLLYLAEKLHEVLNMVSTYLT